MKFNLPIIAGMIATSLFVLSTLPMVLKAYRTKDVKSYSLSNLLLANAGNLIYSVYVFHLPPGPIWLLHSFYIVTTGLMLIWYLRHEWWPAIQRRRERDRLRERNVQPTGTAIPR